MKIEVVMRKRGVWAVAHLQHVKMGLTNNDPRRRKSQHPGKAFWNWRGLLFCFVLSLANYDILGRIRLPSQVK